MIPASISLPETIRLSQLEAVSRICAEEYWSESNTKKGSQYSNPSLPKNHTQITVFGAIIPNICPGVVRANAVLFSDLATWYIVYPINLHIIQRESKKKRRKMQDMISLCFSYQVINIHSGNASECKVDLNELQILRLNPARQDSCVPTQDNKQLTRFPNYFLFLESVAGAGENTTDRTSSVTSDDGHDRSICTRTQEEQSNTNQQNIEDKS